MNYQVFDSLQMKILFIMMLAITIFSKKETIKLNFKLGRQ